MWLFTETGFVSVVQKDPNEDLLTVRARDKESLEDLAVKFGLSIIKTPMADYPYRVDIQRNDFASYVSAEIALLDYPNFKSQVATTRGNKFAKLLGSVWSVMLEAEDGDARAR